MSSLNYMNLYDKIWAFLVKRLKQEIDAGKTQTALAKQIGVEQPTINRWIKKEHGGKVALEDVLKIISGLGVSMKDLAEELGEKDLAILLELFLRDREQVKKIADILASGGSGRRKLEAEIDFIHEQLHKKD